MSPTHESEAAAGRPGQFGPGPTRSLASPGDWHARWSRRPTVTVTVTMTIPSPARRRRTARVSGPARRATSLRLATDGTRRPRRHLRHRRDRAVTVTPGPDW